VGRQGPRSLGPVGDEPGVAAPVQLRFLARPVAANDNRAPLVRRLLPPTLAAIFLIALSFGTYLLIN
jgi:hypothetical protein